MWGEAIFCVMLPAVCYICYVLAQETKLLRDVVRKGLMQPSVKGWLCKNV